MHFRANATAWAVVVASCLAAFWPARAAAVSLKASTLGAVMQQPTSHYYHAAYGALVELAADDRKSSVRLQYVERPEFRSLGFADKDSGWFVQVGTKVSGPRNHGLIAHIGAGRMQGYIKDTASARSYGLPGPTATAEYLWAIGSVDLTVYHQTFIGYVDRREVESYVAWPFNFFGVTAGTRW